MLIFIDDSGDPGFKFDKGSSKVFVIVLIIFHDNLDAEETALKIKRLRQKLGKTENFEFKFNKCSPRFRKEFLTTVKGCNFQIQAVVIKKDKLTQKIQHNFYRHVIMLALKYSKDIKNARLKLDGQGPKKFRQELTNYLRKALNKPGDNIFKNLRFANSKNNVLIQLADMIAGAVRRCFSDKQDSQYYNMIKNREAKITIFDK